MILKRILVILTIVIIISLISSGLLILGDLQKQVNSNVEIYAEDKNNINEKEIIEDNKSFEIPNKNLIQEVQIQKPEVSHNENTNNNSENRITDNITEIDNKNIIIEKEEIKVNNEQPKEDVYTFVKNDVEIQNMIYITKKLILENKENRYSDLVDNVNNINFIIEKSGNLFYPLYEYRIANIVMDNYYPEFYVYAEDVYKNGEYLRTEYYFQ